MTLSQTTYDLINELQMVGMQVLTVYGPDLSITEPVHRIQNGCYFVQILEWLRSWDLECHLKTEPFIIQTPFNHSKSEWVWYSSAPCIWFAITVLKKVPLRFA